MRGPFVAPGPTNVKLVKPGSGVANMSESSSVSAFVTLDGPAADRIVSVATDRIVGAAADRIVSAAAADRMVRRPRE